MSIDEVDNVLKVMLDLGQLMKFTYHPSIRINVDWFGAGIMFKTGALMHGNAS